MPAIKRLRCANRSSPATAIIPVESRPVVDGQANVSVGLVSAANHQLRLLEPNSVCLSRTPGPERPLPPRSSIPPETRAAAMARRWFGWSVSHVPLKLKYRASRSERGACQLCLTPTEQGGPGAALRRRNHLSRERRVFRRVHFRTARARLSARTPRQPSRTIAPMTMGDTSGQKLKPADTRTTPRTDSARNSSSTNSPTSSAMINDRIFMTWRFPPSGVLLRLLLRRIGDRRR